MKPRTTWKSLGTALGLALALVTIGASGAESQPCPKGTPGTVWFKTASPFEYFNDPAKTREARSPDGSMSTVGDVGYVDDDGYLYLTDRSTFMIMGKTIPRGRSLGEIDMRAIAPTLAAILRVPLPDAERPPLPLRAK